MCPSRHNETIRKIINKFGRQQARPSRLSWLPSRHPEKLATGISLEILPNPLKAIDPRSSIRLFCRSYFGITLVSILPEELCTRPAKQKGRNCSRISNSCTGIAQWQQKRKRSLTVRLCLRTLSWQIYAENQELKSSRRTWYDFHLGIRHRSQLC
jgi:hypothetical protein